MEPQQYDGFGEGNRGARPAAAHDYDDGVARSGATSCLSQAGDRQRTDAGYEEGGRRTGSSARARQEGCQGTTSHPDAARCTVAHAVPGQVGGRVEIGVPSLCLVLVCPAVKPEGFYLSSLLAGEGSIGAAAGELAAHDGRSTRLL